MNRLALIERLKDKEDLTLQEIGNRLSPPITGERVRQILVSKAKTLCNLHKVYYLKSCRYCYYEKNYQSLLGKIKQKNLNEEIEKLSRPGRSGELVLKRRLLIKKLHDEMGISFSSIAKLLKRDRTTIQSYYYYKK